MPNKTEDIVKVLVQHVLLLAARKLQDAGEITAARLVLDLKPEDI